MIELRQESQHLVAQLLVRQRRSRGHDGVIERVGRRRALQLILGVLEGLDALVDDVEEAADGILVVGLACHHDDAQVVGEQGQIIAALAAQVIGRQVLVRAHDAAEVDGHHGLDTSNACVAVMDRQKHMLDEQRCDLLVVGALLAGRSIGSGWTS